MFDFLTLFLFIPSLFAQDTPATPTVPSSGDGFMSLFFILPVFLLFYWFFLLRPQQKQEDRLRKMLNSLEKNDRVLTVGGMLATVHSVDKEKNEIVLKVDDSNGTKIKFYLSAIQMIFPKDNEKGEKTETK